MEPAQVDTSAVKHADIIIIGAGVHGIQMARTYLEVHPNDDLIVLEADSCVGGPWGSSRMYDSFISQSPVDFTEFSDRPLEGIPKNELYHGHFPARYCAEYLENYVDNHIYNDRPLRSRIRFCSRVERLTKDGPIWCARTVDGKSYTSPKIVDAVGQTGIPYTPDIPGRDSFSGLQLHQKDFGQSRLLSDSSIGSIAVLGGGKSAGDAAYAAAKAGKTVHWIIRKSGAGSTWIVPATSPTGMHENSTSELWRRCMVPLFASIFAEQGPVSRFLYRSWLGQLIFWANWAFVEFMLLLLSRFGRADGRKNGFHNLKPEPGPFWQNQDTSVANRADYLDTIAKHVQVYRQDIKRLSGSGLELGDGTKVPADAIVYATGWKSELPYIDIPLATKLGLPVPLAQHDKKVLTDWYTIDQKADNVVCAEMPFLARPPPHQISKTHLTPFRLYNRMLPLTDHSIVFVGKSIIAHKFPLAEVEALWAVAVLDNKFPLPAADEMKWEVAKTLAWAKRRYLNKGQLGNYFVWDLIPYTDMLLKQLGLSSHRGQTWWSYTMTPATTSKLKGLVEEYKQKYC